ncbi:lysozyme [Parelusimicrobium proximum]|uniref:glycoside hydrolase family protein n=1 Tax=Parelusimicrobium proximum TaxID=3228953 RepID=UPI003D17E512
MKMSFEEVKRRIISEEGERLKLYKCPAGKLTIGIGHNIEDNGISHAVSEMMFKEDLAEAASAAKKIFLNFAEYSEVKQYILIDMAFNMGERRLRGFKKMIAAMERYDYESVAKEMLDSKWAKQVPSRVQRLVNMMLQEG